MAHLAGKVCRRPEEPLPQIGQGRGLRRLLIVITLFQHDLDALVPGGAVAQCPLSNPFYRFLMAFSLRIAVMSASVWGPNSDAFFLHHVGVAMRKANLSGG